MITLTLDEFGDFEGVKNKREPIFVAGLMYDDHDDSFDLEAEYKRIRSFYRSAIASVSNDRVKLEYPEALHVNHANSNGYGVGKVKGAVNNGLGEFIINGTFNKQELKDDKGKALSPRKGEYKIFLFLKSDEGKEKLLKTNASVLVKDDVASNLYYHIISDMIRRLMFQNPYYPHLNKISIDVATRCSRKLSDMSDKEIKQYKELGYGKKKITSGDELFSLTNADVYRTIISEEIMRTGRTSLNIEKFRVRSIQYDRFGKGDEKNRKLRSYKYEFLYLADSICSYLSYKLPGKNSIEWLEEINKRITKISAKDCDMVFAYDEADVDFSEIISNHEQKNYFDGLSLIFDFKKRTGTFYNYYSSRWIGLIEDYFIKSLSRDDAGFSDAVVKLERYTRQSNIDQEKLLYIYKSLEKAIEYNKESSKRPLRVDTLYKFYDSGISAYCHAGDSKSADLYYKRCLEYVAYVDTGMFLRTLNKYITNLNDLFCYKRALELADNLIEWCELTVSFKEDLLKHLGENISYENTIALELAKAYSQRAQIKSFLRVESAEEDYLKALSLISPNLPDYNITLSYLLHFYLDNRMKDKYDEKAVGYFGGEKSVGNRLRYLSKMGLGDNATITYKYGLYVLVKEIYTFNLDAFDDNLFATFSELNTVYGNDGNRALSGHPCEIIYKYLQLIAIKRNRTDLADKYKAQVKELCDKAGDIIEMIKLYGDYQIEAAKGDISKAGQLQKQLVNELTLRYPSLSISEMREADISAFLDGLFTFMYV